MAIPSVDNGVGFPGGLPHSASRGVLQPWLPPANFFGTGGVATNGSPHVGHAAATSFVFGAAPVADPLLPGNSASPFDFGVAPSAEPPLPGATPCDGTPRPIRHLTLQQPQSMSPPDSHPDSNVAALEHMKQMASAQTWTESDQRLTPVPSPSRSSSAQPCPYIFSEPVIKSAKEAKGVDSHLDSDHHGSTKRKVSDTDVAQPAANSAGLAGEVPKSDSTRSAPRCHLHAKPRAGCKMCKGSVKTRVTYQVESATDSQAEASDHGFCDAIALTNEDTFNFGPEIRIRILRSSYFKSLQNETFSDILQQIFEHATHCEPYERSKAAGEPSTVFCCVYSLMCKRLNRSQLAHLVNHRDSPYIRVAGFLYIRFGLEAREMWQWYQDYLFDTHEFFPWIDQLGGPWTIGRFLSRILERDKFCETTLPRLPVLFKREIGAKLVQVDHLRQAYSDNEYFLNHLQVGARVEALVDGSWQASKVKKTLYENPHLLRVVVRLTDKRALELSLGMIRPRVRSRVSPSRHSRSKSRSRSTAKRIASRRSRRHKRSYSEPKSCSPSSRSRSPNVRDTLETTTSDKLLYAEYERKQNALATVQCGVSAANKTRSLKWQLIGKGMGYHHHSPTRGPHVHPADRPSVAESVGTKAERIHSESPAMNAERQQQLMEVMQKYGSTGGGMKAKRIEYHEACSGLSKRQANTWDLVDAPDTLRLG